ncbi:ParB/Srx family N-terminal domain-containing protein [uncultured Desulfosarcina sp.]|uniref:ParB/Srx family N-terminal domain-containing protein n=1 Tax=uncultured Desulfosarcina sp. TaxID=218289 RepID=UPI0029C8C37E|nr:ParB/Srx family N-terminal domain-containing protein [uncultured Desulfosarcina sp.]
MKASYTIIDVDIEQVELDRNNPRIAKYIEMYGDEVTAEQIALALNVGDSSAEQNSTTFQSLKASIRTNGGVIHPIIINKQPDGKLVVIEGNTRVAIYKDFKEEKVTGNWDKIPAVVYEAMSQEEIDSIRLQAHLVGPRPWDPYSKAKYLNHLRNTELLTFKQIVDYCGGREGEVRDYIEAYNEMERYYRPLLDSDDEFDPKRFSAFVELQRKNVRDAIVHNGFDFSDFSKWVIDFKIHPLQSVRKLPMILKNKKAREAFIKFPGKGAIDAAIKQLEQPATDAVLNEATLEQLAREITKRIRTLPYEKFQELKENTDSAEVQALIDAKDQLTGLCSDIDAEK